MVTALKSKNHENSSTSLCCRYHIIIGNSDYIMVTLNLPFNEMFYITCLGQILVVVMVYKILRDDYKTGKTFADFYEDHPIGKEKITLS